MPDVSAVTDPRQLLAQELLKRRGLAASNGRYTMFPDDPSVGAGQGDAAAALAARNGATVSPAGTATGGVSSASPVANAANAGGELPVPDETLDGMDEGTVAGLLTALGLGGAALAAYLLRRRSKMNPTSQAGLVSGGTTAAGDIPVVEGEVIHPSAKTPVDSPIVEGEIVEPSEQIGNTKRISQGVVQPDNQGAKSLGAPKQVDLEKPSLAGVLTDQRKPDIRARARATIQRQSRTIPNDMGTISAADAMTDLTPEERTLATSLVQQLRQNRRAGNAINTRRLQGKRNLRSTLPTGTVDENKLLGLVVGAIRKARLNPSTIAKAVR
jgi:hypothetical protein